MRRAELWCLSTETPSRAHDPACQRLHGNSFSENWEHGMIKGVWQELFAPFLTLPASFKSSVVGVWILSKPSLTESLCQFFLAPSSYCGLGTSTRKINTLISSTAAALRRFLCLLWSCSNPPEATRVPRRGLECRQSGGTSPLLSYTWWGIWKIRSCPLNLLQESRVFQSHTQQHSDQHTPGFIARKAKHKFNSLTLSMGWTMDLDLHCCLSSIPQTH